jgi:glycine dehydrogenase
MSAPPIAPPGRQIETSRMTPTSVSAATLAPTDDFVGRHVGPSDDDIRNMLAVVGRTSLEALVDAAVPGDIRLREPLHLPRGVSEYEALCELRRIAAGNRVLRAMIGMGYYDCITPPVILRNIFENPGWYTQYTPYQAEISQGRLEALLNFQTMVAELTGLPLANASLLDEATAAAEAMYMAWSIGRHERNVFLVAADCHPQTIAVVQTRARPLGIHVEVCDADALARGRQPMKLADGRAAFGVLVQYPTTDGRIVDHDRLAQAVHAAGAMLIVATDLLALTLIRPPGEFDADIAVGSAQRFGVPLGGGGPHAAFLATREKFARQIPGRLIGVSKDAHGRPAYRLAIQTREQHIRREKATSNICTAQVLLAVMAGMYAVYHGPDGLRRIAQRVHALAAICAEGLRRIGLAVGGEPLFDTVRVEMRDASAAELARRACDRGINIRVLDSRTVCMAFDETCSADDVRTLWELFADGASIEFTVDELAEEADLGYARTLARRSAFLTHPVFNRYHSEHEMLRYIRRLESRDLSLTTSMIPLGSCTMKLNAAAEMLPVSWPEFARIHPYAPADQQRGYAELFAQLERWLAAMTGFSAVSLQPNSGAQGEFAGLLAIRAYHASRGQAHRTVCLIPTSAHGTNPASATLAGMHVVAVACDNRGNVDLTDLAAKAEAHAADLSALMITYPSTHGVFEADIRRICEVVHRHGGQVYMDGANLNAQLGLTRPADIGADVCHLNLHKTFCIPHGGGGPGMGPIAAAGHLAPFLPGYPLGNEECRMQNAERPAAATPRAGANDSAAFCIHHSALPATQVGPVAAAPYGSASILPISWMYIRMMGTAGLTKATQVAILNANYMSARLASHFPVLYTGDGGCVAHEFIIDCRQFEDAAGVKVEDIAKRLMDYGFHAPTMSFPVPGTLMIEPTESESQAELDRLCDALIAIREEIRAIETGCMDRADNPLKHAPHTAQAVCAADWPHGYSRELAAYPAAWLREHKFWPAVGRIDNVYGDRNLFCTCPPVGT